MIEQFSALLVPFALNFLAELGDKTQLLALSFTAKYRYQKGLVIGGLLLSTMVLMGLAVILGGWISNIIPTNILRYVVSAVFIVWGVLALIKQEEEEAAQSMPARRRYVFWIIFMSYSAAELGDKTQLVTMALAVRYQKLFLVWLGSVLGMAAVNIGTVLLGHFLLSKVSERIVNYVVALLFLLFGVLNLFV